MKRKSETTPSALFLPLDTIPPLLATRGRLLEREASQSPPPPSRPSPLLSAGADAGLVVGILRAVWRDSLLLSLRTASGEVTPSLWLQLPAGGLAAASLAER